MRIELNNGQIARWKSAGDGIDVGVRDRMVTTQDDRNGSRFDDRSHCVSQGTMIEVSVPGAHKCVAVVDHSKLVEGVDPEIHVPDGRAEVRSRSDLAGTETSTRSVSNHLVHRCPHDHHIGFDPT
jgi:hypothetical protein